MRYVVTSTHYTRIDLEPRGTELGSGLVVGDDEIAIAVATPGHKVLIVGDPTEIAAHLITTATRALALGHKQRSKPMASRAADKRPTYKQLREQFDVWLDSNPVAQDLDESMTGYDVPVLERERVLWDTFVNELERQRSHGQVAS